MHEMKKLSKNSKYYMSNKRYLELKNFCLQYDEWKQELKSISLIPAHSDICVQQEHGDAVWNTVERRMYYENRIALVDNSLVCVDLFVRPYIFEAVTTGRSYDALITYPQVPCCKQVYYQYYRKFFYVLDKTQKLQSF